MELAELLERNGSHPLADLPGEDTLSAHDFRVLKAWVCVPGGLYLAWLGSGAYSSETRLPGIAILGALLIPGAMARRVELVGVHDRQGRWMQELEERTGLSLPAKAAEIALRLAGPDPVGKPVLRK